MSKKSKASFFIINNLNGKIFYIMNKIITQHLQAISHRIYIYIDRRGEGQC